MTRDTILAILDVHLSSHKAINGKWEAADRILAAIESEREQEARDGWRVEFAKGQSTITLLLGVEHEGKQGQLIFRPTKAKETGL